MGNKAKHRVANNVVDNTKVVEEINEIYLPT